MNKMKVLSIVLILFSLISCSRHIESRDPVRSLIDSGPVPSNLTVTINNNSVDLSWEISLAAAVARYNVYMAESDTADFVLIETTPLTNYTINDLTADKVYFFKVASIIQTGLEGPPSEIVSVKMSLLSIVILSNKGFINTRNLQISLNAPSTVTLVILSEDSLFADADYASFTPTKNFRLSDGDELKTVYARYRFADGSQSGDPISDEVTLDTKAEINSVSFNPVGSTFSPGDTVFFELSAAETGGNATVSFGSINALPLYDDGTNNDIVAGDALHNGFYVVPANLNIASVLVTGSFHDQAGNAASPVSSTDVLTIYSPPIPVTLSVSAESSSEIRLNWTASTSSNFSVYRIYRDILSNVDETSELIDVIQNRSTTFQIDTDLDAGIAYYYRIYVYDRSGLKAGSNTENATTLLNNPPEAVELFLAGQTTSTADFAWTTSLESDFESYRIFRAADTTVSNSDVMVGYVTSSTSNNLTYDPPAIGDYFFRIYVYDQQGLATASVNSIKVQFTE